MGDRPYFPVEDAERALAHRAGKPIRLGPATVLTGEGRRATVARVGVEDGPEGTPPTVIVKQTRVEPAERDPDGPNHARQRFLAEAATLEFLDTLSTPTPFSPELLGVDVERRVIVLEDLGDGVSLADLLTGNDPQAAAAGLNAYARTLGRLHAETTGRAEEFFAIARKHSGGPSPSGALPGAWGRDELPRFKRACEILSVPIDGAFQREVDSIEAALAAPGPWLTFNVSDACPDNHFMVEETVRFFDFEFSGFGHALIDGAYLHLPFPTCWCVSRLPAGVQAEAERIYRDELTRGCPIAADDRVYEDAMLMVCAAWTIATVSWTLERVLVADDRWGLISHRQRHMYRLEALVHWLDRDSRFPGLRRVAAQLAAVLRRRWPEISADLPLYPAFL